jgi:hypothetical protein
MMHNHLMTKTKPCSSPAVHVHKLQGQYLPNTPFPVTNIPKIAQPTAMQAETSG